MVTKVILFGVLGLVGLYVLAQLTKTDPYRGYAPPIVPSNPNTDGWFNNINTLLGQVPGIVGAFRGDNAARPSFGSSPVEKI
jgi:hypothetical protein